jgi:hypothetical protein
LIVVRGAGERRHLALEVGDPGTLLLDGITIVERDAVDIVVENPSFEASGKCRFALAASVVRIWQVPLADVEAELPPYDLVGSDVLLVCGSYPKFICEGRYHGTEERGWFLVECGNYAHSSAGIEYRFLAGSPTCRRFSLPKRYEIREGFQDPDSWFVPTGAPQPITEQERTAIIKQMAGLLHRARCCPDLPTKNDEKHRLLGRAGFETGRYAEAFKLVERPDKHEDLAWVSDLRPKQARDVFYITQAFR